MSVPLGALGRRFESCRPDWNVSEKQKQVCAKAALGEVAAKAVAQDFRSSDSAAVDFFQS